MKYVKILSLESKPAAVVAQCFDVPLNMLIPVSIAGEFDKTDRIIKEDSLYYININETKHNVKPKQIIGLCINKIDPNLNGPDRFSYLYDDSAKRRVFIGDLNAFSWGELVMKLAIAGLVYSTDDEIMEVPAALKTVTEQKKEIERLSDRIETLQSDLSSASSRLQEKDEMIAKLETELTTPPPERKKRSWKRMFENIFGSEDSPSYDG
jgi:hypothetical protein